ncbi:DUF6370 family protein [Hymenobacter sp. IS2118]|uniref:DUF6370 family protein n=1 Tax=Hymenobacter sp. IS2118 TaxID=1505605 RepID=UPI000A88F665|nr:DUF6370 family protein [Hymenobacter sp. IS2118]
MKVLLPLLLLIGLATATPALAQRAPAPPNASSAAAPADTLLVDAACGQCRLGLPGKGCDLAVRVAGRAYFVAGTGIDSHGDAHASTGFCNAIRQARVQGNMVGNTFNVSYFELVPVPAAATPSQP